MRVRRDVAKSWELKCDRPFLCAGSGRESTVAAWAQVARAEIAKATGARYAQVLLDLGRNSLKAAAVAFKGRRLKAAAAALSFSEALEVNFRRLTD